MSPAESRAGCLSGVVLQLSNSFLLTTLKSYFVSFWGERGCGVGHFSPFLSIAPVMFLWFWSPLKGL